MLLLCFAAKRCELFYFDRTRIVQYDDVGILKVQTCPTSFDGSRKKKYKRIGFNRFAVINYWWHIFNRT